MRRCSHHNDCYDDAFDKLLEQSWTEYEQKQRAFEDEISPYSKWHHTRSPCVLELRRYFFLKKSYAVTPIGTFLPSTMNWCWAWANDVFTEDIRQRAASVKSLWDITHYDVFTAPHFNVTHAEIDELCAMALHVLEGRGVFKIKDSEPWIYLVVH